MYFAFPAILLLLFYVGQELTLRKKSGLGLTSWRELISFTFKNTKSAVHPRLRRAEEFFPFVFAFLCALLFGFWESVLWMLFGRPGNILIGFLGLGLLALMILRRRQKQRPLSEDPHPYRELLGVWTGIALSMQPILTILFLTPWVVYRARKIRAVSA